jgi:hypothetical protein
VALRGAAPARGGRRANALLGETLRVALPALCVTGQGLKTTDPLAGKLGAPPVIGARLADVETLLKE